MTSGLLPIFVALGAMPQPRLEESGLTVVRRCDDLADLLAATTTGQARCVLLAADLPGLDRETVLRLGSLDVATVVLVEPHDTRGERWLRQLGVRHVLASDSSAPEIGAAVAEAVSQLEGGIGGYADPAASLRALFAPVVDVMGEPGQGRVVAVWGPTGAPGRTTLATSLAAELAEAGWPALLVDADVYGGSVAATLGLPDETSGLAAACRLANGGALDVPALAALAPANAGLLRVLTGLDRAARWVELRPGSVEVTLDMARSLAAVTVVDCGFCLEQDEELSYDTLAPRRNGVTLAVLQQADLVVAVGSADPLGLQRLVAGLHQLKEAAPQARTAVVLNRLRPGVLPGEQEEAARTFLNRFAGVDPVAAVPFDPSVDQAAAAGRALLVAHPHSSARLAMRSLAAALVGARAEPRRRRLLRRERPRARA